MGLKSFFSIPYARYHASRLKKVHVSAIHAQSIIFHNLLEGGKETLFGQDHNFSKIKTYQDFKNSVPIRDYEESKKYIDLIIDGRKDVLWRGKPIYFCKTSGTTSGTKYIPITKDSMPNHILSARNALLSYIAETGDASFVNGKMIFLQGSPELEKLNGIAVGRLSGIVANHVPAYLLKNRMPTYATNCIEDWEEKVDAIVEETIKEDMALISGIPSWVQMYFEKLIKKTGKENIKEIFPNFSLFVYGGVNFEPYRSIFEKTIGTSLPSIELYPASEGFIAFQDSQKASGMLLIVDSGIFYEFIPVEDYYNESPLRISLEDVEVGVYYALIINSNAGLWGYSIGDIIKFVSVDPYRIIVAGRLKHFISAFGEHVIAEEVESAMSIAVKKEGIEVLEFHVAPQVNPPNGLPYHEWSIEFANDPGDICALAIMIDRLMQEKNVYYKDLIEGKVLRKLVIRKISKNGFVDFMRPRGKLGGQNKVPRLANDRQFADELSKFAE